jgi:hypothetical protein
MHSSGLRYFLRAGLFFGLVCLAWLGLSLFAGPGAQARLAEPRLWQDDGYPPPDTTEAPIDDGTDEGYPPPDGTGTPTSSVTPGVVPTTTTPPTPQQTLTTAAAPGETLLPAEQAETLAPTETPQATSTPTGTITVTPSVTPTPALQSTLEARQAGDGGSFQVDWGYFWIGFAIPVLAGCGVVLYLLDRRPDLFRPRSRP